MNGLKLNGFGFRVRNHFLFPFVKMDMLVYLLGNARD